MVNTGTDCDAFVTLFKKLENPPNPQIWFLGVVDSVLSVVDSRNKHMKFYLSGVDLKSVG